MQAGVLVRTCRRTEWSAERERRGQRPAAGKTAKNRPARMHGIYQSGEQTACLA